MVGEVSKQVAPSPIKHAQVHRADIIRMPRQLDLLGASPAREVDSLRLKPIQGSRLDTWA